MKYFVLYLVVEILQLVHEISSFPEVPYQRSDLESFSKFTGAVARMRFVEDILENLAKFTDKHLARTSFKE